MPPVELNLNDALLIETGEKAAHMEMMTQEEFACLPTTRLRAGDVLLFDRRETIGRGVDVASTMIRSVQGRLLRDLG